MPGISKKGSRGFQPTTVEGSDHVWNTGKQFSLIKIMKLLQDLDTYELIAQYGTESMDQEIYGGDIIARRRYEAMERLISTERMLIGNANFAFKKKDRAEINYCLKLLNEVVRPFLYTILDSHDDEIARTTELKINEFKFSKLFQYLVEIKDKLNIFLNNAGLIFRESEDISLDELSKGIIEGG